MVVPTQKGEPSWRVQGMEAGTWIWEGPLLPRMENNTTTSSLRLSRTADGAILAYGQRNYLGERTNEFARVRNEPILCRSADGARTWSASEVIPTRVDGPFEISNPIAVLGDDR